MSGTSKEGRMKYSKLSDMFSLHYLLDQKCARQFIDVQTVTIC